MPKKKKQRRKSAGMGDKAFLGGDMLALLGGAFMVAVRVRGERFKMLAYYKTHCGPIKPERTQYPEFLKLEQRNKESGKWA